MGLIKRIKNAFSKSKNAFRLTAKKIKLTYPKRKNGKSFIHSKEILHNALLGKFKDRKIKVKTLITAYEISEDQHEHYHCYIEFDRKIDVQDPHYFDVCSAHGEYSTIKGSPNPYIEYTQKDGSYLLYDPGINSYTQKPKTQNQIVLFIVNKVITWKYTRKYKKYINLSVPELFYKAVSKLEPIDNAEICKDLNKSAKQFINILRTKYGHIYDESNLRYDISTFNELDLVKQWLDQDRYLKTLYLYGPSGVGKTEYAKSLIQPALVTNLVDQSKEFTPGYHKCIILDDPEGLKQLKREALIAILDRENTRGWNIKHSHAVIPANTPLIIVSNLDIFQAFHESCYEILDNIKCLKKEISRRILWAKVEHDLRSPFHLPSV